MRLSELIGARVICSDGVSVGKVHDIRLVRGGPSLGAFGPTYRAEALFVGNVGVGVRLGYHRDVAQVPFLVGAFFKLLRRGSRQIPWESVAAIEEGRIRLRITSYELSSSPRAQASGV